jgi:tryptophanyl-tRNA synthetase
MKEMDSNALESKTFIASLQRSREIEWDISQNPSGYRVLTGDRPTGPLHIGHLFGSLQNRVKFQNTGIETFIVIADYQVLTDRESASDIARNVRELVIDYLAAGIDPDHQKTSIFPQSQIPELNQLLVPFLFLVSNSELDRNPTVKEEIAAAGLKNISAGMYVYPVHQAADILSVKGNLVPVGKDQLPHLELCRLIARRFNKRFGNDKVIFKEPEALLSSSPNILGLDGTQKMSKSRNNAIFLSATADETAKLIKKAKTDSIKAIYYDSKNRPEVANLLHIVSLATGLPVESVAESIGDGGSARLKQVLTDSLNEYLAPIRKRRQELQQDEQYIREVLNRGIQSARTEAVKTLTEVRQAMNMDFTFPGAWSSIEA